MIIDKICIIELKILLNMTKQLAKAHNLLNNSLAMKFYQHGTKKNIILKNLFQLINPSMIYCSNYKFTKMLGQ